MFEFLIRYMCPSTYRREGNKVHVSGGRFLMKKTVTFGEHSFGSFTNSHIRWSPSVGYEDAPMFVFPHTGPGYRFPIGQ